MKTGFLFLVMMAGFLGEARAEVPNCSTEFTEACAKASLAQADQALNGVYGDAMGCLPEKEKGMLRQAQRIWLAWREAQARFDSATPWGAGYTISMDTITRERIEVITAVGRHCHQTLWPDMAPKPPVQ